MANLTKHQIAELSAMGIQGKTEEVVRPLILEKLKAHEIFDMNEDPLDDLITILSAFEEIANNDNESKVEEQPVTKELLIEEDDEEEIIVKKEQKVKAAKKVSVKKQKEEEIIEEISENIEALKVVKPTSLRKSSIMHYSGNNPEHVKILSEYFQPIIDNPKFIVGFQPATITVRLSGSVSARTVICLVDVRFVGDRVRANIHYKSLNMCKDLDEIVRHLSEAMAENSDLIDDLSVRETKILYPHFKNVFFEDFEKYINNFLLEKLASRIERLDSKLEVNRKKIIEAVESVETVLEKPKKVAPNKVITTGKVKSTKK